MSKTFTIEKGRVVKVNGLPYECLGDVQVSGWREPEWPVGPLTGPASGSANAPDQPGGPTSPHAAEPDAASVASDGSDRVGWAVGLAEQINGRFSSIFGWPEGFVVAEPTPEGGLKLSIGWNDIQVRKDGSSVGGGTDMGTHRMAGVVREAYKIVNPPPSDCSQSGCMPPDYQPEGPIPQFSDPPAADSCEQKRE
jgi:hypothetical protein